MTSRLITPYRDALLTRALPDGAFAVAQGEGSRPDATAWAAIALYATGGADKEIAAARAALTRAQLTDGSVPVIAQCPRAAWPTSLAILAWLPDPSYRSHVEAAGAWLLSHPGKHWPKDARAVFAHDPSIKGWPWIDDTHSWVEPTAQAMLALIAMGLAEAPQIAEAGRMLLDRQLPDGGWNYGNTKVFRNTLLPFPEATGLALAALGAMPKRPDRAKVAASIAYLSQPQCAVPTPLTAVWRAFGLTAWDAAPPDALDLVATCLEKQTRYGPYDTPLLAQAVAALASDGRFEALLHGGAHG